MTTSSYDPAEVQKLIDEAERSITGKAKADPRVRAMKPLLSATKSMQREIEVLKMIADNASQQDCPDYIRCNDRGCAQCWRAWAEAEVDKKGNHTNE